MQIESLFGGTVGISKEHTRIEISKDLKHFSTDRQVSFQLVFMANF